MVLIKHASFTYFHLLKDLYLVYYPISSFTNPKKYYEPKC